MRSDFVKWFDSLDDRDFENGAVLDEIRKQLVELEKMKETFAFCELHKDWTDELVPHCPVCVKIDDVVKKELDTRRLRILLDRISNLCSSALGRE